MGPNCPANGQSSVLTTDYVVSFPAGLPWMPGSSRPSPRFQWNNAVPNYVMPSAAGILTTAPHYWPWAEWPVQTWESENRMQAVPLTSPQNTSRVPLRPNLSQWAHLPWPTHPPHCKYLRLFAQPSKARNP